MMDFITSYSSSDSENELSDTKPNTKSENEKKQILEGNANLTSHNEENYQKQELTSKRKHSENNQDGNYSTTLSNSDFLLGNKSNKLNSKRHITGMNTVPNKDVIKPYIPKSKRSKLLNDSESSQGLVTLNSPTKLSVIFQTAKVFTKQANPHHRVPKNHLANFEAHQGCANRISWNPHFADFLLSASMDSFVKVWNVETTPCCVYQVQSHSQAVKDAKWSHSGLQILSCGYDKTARITDVNLGKQICELKHNSFVTSVQYHPSNHSVFLSGTSSDGIFAWDIRTQSIVTRYKSFFGQVQDLVFYRDGESFISAAEVLKRNSTDKGIMVWDYKTSTILSNQVFQEAYTCTALRMHPTDNVFLAQSNAGYIAVFSQKSPFKLNKYKRFEGHQVSGYHIGFDISPDGSLVASGSADGSLTVYNYRSSNVVKTFPSHSQPCMDVAWSPSLPSLLASCGWNGTIALHK